MSARVLIAGVGNIFFGDDGFGSEVARRLLGRSQPDGVRVVDFGIRGLDLTLAMLDGYQLVILIDVVRRGGAPGTLYVIEPEPQPDGQTPPDPHGMDPARVLSVVQALGGQTSRLRLVGCEPGQILDGEEMSMGLSAPVQAALDGAVELVDSLLRELPEGATHHA